MSKYDLSNVLLLARMLESSIRRMTNYDSVSALEVCVIVWGTNKDATTPQKTFCKNVGGGFLPLPPQQRGLCNVVNVLGLFTLIHKCFTNKLLKIYNEINYKS